MSMSRHTGRCYCGAVTFAFAEAPLMARACWCRDCQYLSAGNASINAVFPSATFELQGEVAEYVSTADSGNVMRRRFCPRCGTQLFSQSSARPDVMVVRVGALDDRSVGRPSGFIWTDSAPDWGHVDPDLANFPGQPGPAPTR